MNTELIGQNWDKLIGKHDILAKMLYERLFKQYPNYKSLFSESAVATRMMEKAVKTLALVARVDEPELVHSQLVKLGDKHRRFSLKREDIVNFKQVFLEVLEEYCLEHCPDAWNDKCSQAWNDAFNELVIPYMAQGLEHNITPSEMMRIINMQTSAVNQLLGTVTSIKQESVNAEVILQLKGGDHIVAIITPLGVENLGLKIGSQAHAIVRGPHVMLMHADTGLKTSVRNWFCGKVTKTEIGLVNAQVSLQLKSGNVFQAVVAKETVQELDIKKGERVCCFFKAIDVILAVETGIELLEP
ncbi:TOBE domain-containing protein [Candidatus Parabeggiatoa sp. HSG14]|uniref:TOBE domain-containing protein n=1 Tax=Candidatus Parabeggiatoa sp. HSG14 TaxID=3055593 RepID=UPI0025A6FC90|nr:TOBE domain-containing protein [Thiotrichales bacterium HSG14]